jgi:hypothetical protein
MSIKINFGEILSKAWQITWKFKVLWIFGILAGCAGNNSSNFNWNTGSNNSDSGNNGAFEKFLPQLGNMQPEQLFQQYMSQYMAIIVAVLVLLCVLWAVFFFLGMIGKVGLIKGASKADGGASSMRFAEIWTESLPYFWRMFGLNLLVGLPFFLLVVILMVILGVGGFSAYKSGVSGGGMAAVMIGMMGIFFAFICVISILSMIVGMIVQQAQNAIVLEELGVLESLGRGWNVFKSSVLSIVLMAIILAIMGGLVGLVVALPLMIVMIPAAIGVAATSGTAGMAIPMILGGCCFVILLPIILLVSGIIQTYTQTAWTLTYLRLTVQPAPPAPALDMAASL